MGTGTASCGASPHFCFRLLITSSLSPTFRLVPAYASLALRASFRISCGAWRFLPLHQLQLSSDRSCRYRPPQDLRWQNHLDMAHLRHHLPRALLALLTSHLVTPLSWGADSL